MKVLVFEIITVFVLAACSDTSITEAVFQPVPGEVSDIDFNNSLEYTEELNPYTFKNFYNGAGVAVGDINNDGLPDIFFCGNMVSNRLYLNKGELKFEDITEKAGVGTLDVWSTGVSMIDIDADGWLDIYVSKSGPPDAEDRSNELLINNGDLTFTDRTSEFGLDNIGLSVHASFLDFDKDGDLDCYLLNNAIKSIGNFGIVKDKRLIPDTLGANKFLRNDNGFFHDITLESGIYSSEIGFGLGATVGDINGDNWPDIYISNDFFEKDYLYINQRDGTFKDKLEDYVTEISMGSMGADLADINNDGHPEYFVTEMIPERRDRQVTKAFFDTWEGFKNSQEKGYYNQFGRNVLQLNNGDGTFSEIGRYAGVEATDWSWAALIFDMDNDGLRDIFVANGIYKDLLDLDYLNFMANPDMVRARMRTNQDAISSMIDMMPSEPVPNYFYVNNGDLTFTNKASDWDLNLPTFSNGSAYGDLDNDGDLDLVVNNVNMASIIYENRTRQIFPERTYLTIQLLGTLQNTQAIGAKVHLYTNDQVLYAEQNPIHGFQSSVDYNLHFGLNETVIVDSIVVTWPSDKVSILKDVPVNQTIKISEKEALISKSEFDMPTPSIFEEYLNPDLEFRHVENEYNDFEKDRLLFHMNSTEGPCICKGDVNNDSRDDIFIGGGSGQSGRLFIQGENEKFEVHNSYFQPYSESEDLDCVFFDANNDGNMDLYITSGGSEFGSISLWLNDRLYLGDGKGGLEVTKQRLPTRGFESTSKVLPLDYDNDGDLDLFVGGRSVPFFYGIPADSYVLENDGNGNYSGATDKSFGILKRIGMVTDAALADLDKDGTNELIVVGRWMPVKVFKISEGQISDVSNKWGMQDTDGWYNSVKAEDLNNDGLVDLIVGNHGLNSRFHASFEEPIEMLVGDLDGDGGFDQLISMYHDGVKYPFAQLKDLATKSPSIGAKYSSFNDYKYDEFDVVIPKEISKAGQTIKAYNLETGVFINDGKKMTFQKLPPRAQLSPVYAIEFGDFNKDGINDIILGGNFAESKPEVGSYLAGFGDLFVGSGDGKFQFVPNSKAGIRIKGSVRDIEQLRIGKKNILIFTRNNDDIYTIQFNEELQ